MAWVYLDDQFPDHPKVVAAGGEAAWLFVCGLAYCRRFGTEGVIPKGKVPRLADVRSPGKLAGRLVDVVLWEDHGDCYRIHDYSEWNRPGEARSSAAKKAAAVRWKGDAKGNANASKSHSERTTNAHASTCPNPLPNPLRSNSNGFTSSSADPVGDAVRIASDDVGPKIPQDQLTERRWAARGRAS